MGRMSLGLKGDKEGRGWEEREGKRGRDLGLMVVVEGRHDLSQFIFLRVSLELIKSAHGTNFHSSDPN
jgi:hypothetical protein